MGRKELEYEMQQEQQSHSVVAKSGLGEKVTHWFSCPQQVQCQGHRACLQGGRHMEKAFLPAQGQVAYCIWRSTVGAADHSLLG